MLRNHPFLIGFSIIFTIHFGGKIPLFLGSYPFSGATVDGQNPKQPPGMYETL